MGVDLIFIECNHPKGMVKKSRCERLYGNKCILYQVCENCGVETILDFVERCDECYKEVFVDVSVESSLSENFTVCTTNRTTKNTMEGK